MSPVNSDDSYDGVPEHAGLPLTRKELRSREKFLATESNSIVPEQAFQPSSSVSPTVVAERTALPPLPPAVPATALPPAVPAAALAPAVPAAAPVAEEIHVSDYETVGDRISDVPDSYISATPYQDYARQDEDPHEQAAPDALHGAGYEQFSDHQTDADYGMYYDREHHQIEADHEVFGGTGVVAMVSAPSKNVRRRRRFLVLVLTLTVFVAAIAFGAQFIKPLLGTDKPGDYPGPGTGQVNVAVLSGEGAKSIAAKLEAEKVIANADTFITEFAAAGATLKPGDFSFRQEMKNADAVAVLLDKDQAKVMYFALNAGLRIGESLQAISTGSGVPLAELQALSDSPAQFGVPAAAKSLEGFLAPGEYRFALGTPAKEILQSLVKGAMDELNAQGITDPAKQYEVITIASIVQAEGGQAEYGDVAGAIYNRLKPNNSETNGLIQSDATVTYGLGRKSFHITEGEKADKSNPYNTYANTGLPVGPIGSPGKTAIDAAAKPKANEYLYWVTINLDTKETKFSKTLAEHNGYAAQYNSWCEANAGRCM